MGQLVLHLPTVFQEGFDCIVRSTEVEHERGSLPLKDQPQIQTTATFHERLDSSQPHPSMQMRATISVTGGPHCRENLGASCNWNACQEARCGQQLHGVRSASSVISRN